MTPLLIQGMHGMGDCVHQRAIVRALMKRHTIWLETSWPCIYHDLVSDNLHLLRRPVALRTQLKNSAREADKFSKGPAPHHHMPMIHMTYSKATVANGTILKAMFLKAGIPAEYDAADYRLPIPQEWMEMLARAGGCFDTQGKPLMIYRPLVARPEWRGSMVRNANADDYAAIFATIRDSFFVVSVADLEPMREWIVGPVLKPDVTLHKGELPFEALAALFARAKCIYTSSGFGAVLAPAVGTPCISVQGGYEPASWHADGAKFAPWLGIDPMQPCTCASSACTNPCKKTIDVALARDKVRAFVSAHCGVSASAESRPVSEMFGPVEQPAFVRQPPHTLPRPARLTRIGHPSLLNRPGGVRA